MCFFVFLVFFSAYRVRGFTVNLIDRLSKNREEEGEEENEQH